MAEDLGEPGLYERVARTVEAEMAADGVTLGRDTAWNFMYRYGLEINDAGLPRIVESNVLRQGIWARRAERVRDWLQSNLIPGQVLSHGEVSDRLNKAWKLAQAEGFAPAARANVSGLALENGLSYLIERFCGTPPLIKKSLREFRGFELARAAEVDELDMALFTFDDFRFFISCVWTTRKDRIASDLYEAAFLRRRRPDVAIGFVVNEFHSNLITHLEGVPEVDRIYHVGLPALLEAHRPRRNDGVAYTNPLESRAATAAFSTYLNIHNYIHDLSALFADIDKIKPS